MEEGKPFILGNIYVIMERIVETNKYMSKRGNKMDRKLCYGCMEYLQPGLETCSCGFDQDTYETEPHHLTPGTLLKERYLVGRVLGEGGFGITYVGRDTVLDMKVAVKEFYMSGYVNRNNTYSTLVRASVGSHQELFEKNKEKFLTEARVLARFATEEGIVGIRDFFQENNTAYIVMDFLTGETLRDCLSREKSFTWQRTLDVMRPVINSLGNVHGHNVIHRDISPDNIMLTTDGKVKLLDFGAAREVSQTDIKSLSVILKPGYAPEEQYRSKGNQGPWTDIYALCATMYCCITGVVPEDSMERMFEDKLKSPHVLNPDCAPAVSNVIMKGMAVRQKDRYQSIAEFKKDLDMAEKNPQDTSIAADGGNVQGAVNSPSASPERGISAADANATVYAGEIKENPSGTSQSGNVSQTRQVADVNATVYAGEISTAAETPVVETPAVEKVKTSETTAPAERTEKKEMPAGKPVNEKTEANTVEEVKAEKQPEEQPAEKEKPVTVKKEEKKEKKAEAPKKEKKAKNASGKKKGKLIGIIAAAAVVLLIAVFGIKTAVENKAAEKVYNMIPANLQEMSIILNGTKITLPAKYEDFVAVGWEVKDPADLKEEVNPKRTLGLSVCELETGKNSISLYLKNVSDSVMMPEDCYVMGISISGYGMSEGVVKLADGSTFYKTTRSEMAAKYPALKLSKDGKVSMLNMEEDGKSYLIQFNASYGDVFSYLNMQVDSVPDYVESYLTEMPQIDMEAFNEKVYMNYYLKLERSSNYVTDGILRPTVFVKDYMDAGWKVKDGPEYLASGKTEQYFTIQADNRTSFRICASNYTKTARALENCLVTQITSIDVDQLLTEDTLYLMGDDGFSVNLCEANLKDALISAVNTAGLKGSFVVGELDGNTYTIYPYGKNDERKISVLLDNSGSLINVKYDIPNSLFWEFEWN